MNKIILAFCLTLSIFNINAAELKVMSFNTMCKLCDPKKNYGPFDQRLENIVDTVKRNNPDLIAMQEVQNSRHAKKISEKLNNEYHVLYRRIWFWPGTDSMLLVRKSRFEVINRDGIWLGPKAPDFSLGWTKRTPRKLEWAHLKDKVTNKEFKFMGIHLDNNSENKFKSSEYISQMIANESLPVILAGDSNLNPTQEGFHILLGDMVDSFSQAPKIEWNQNSPLDIDEQCGEGDSPYPDCRIDHVFYSKSFGLKTTHWIYDLYKYHENKWHVSDHRAVMAVFDI